MNDKRDLLEKHKELFLKIVNCKDSIDLNGLNEEEKITDEKMIVVCQALRKNTSFKEIHFWYNEIGSNGIQNLAEILKINSTLINLNLSWNHLIGLEGIRSLSECLKINSTITTLHLSSNKMGDQEIDLLCESLILNSTLKELDLSYNNIGDEGMKIISETLKINSSLEDINLFNNKIKDKGAHSLLEALFFNYSLKNLTINGNQNKIGEYLQDEISNMVKENKSKPERAIKRVEKNMKKSSLIKFSLIFLVNLFFLLF